MFKSLRDVVKLSWIYVLSNSIVECLFPFILANLILLLFSRSTCPTLCNSMNCSMLGLSVHYYLPDFLKLMSIDSVMPSNHLILCPPLLLLPSVFLSIWVFSNELALHIRRPKFYVVLSIVCRYSMYSMLYNRSLMIIYFIVQFSSVRFSGS